MSTPIDTVLAILRDEETFVLTTHVNPDGDGIGSEIALAEWLSAHHKEVRIINHSPTPEVYRFLDPKGRILIFNPERDAELIASADVIVVLDINHPGRLRSMESNVLESRAVKICIDHHPDPAPFARHYLLDDDATSTGEIVYRVLTADRKEGLEPLVAQALYCAIITDTGSFRYPRVDPEIFRIAAHLVECGADPVAIYSEVYQKWSTGRVHLLGEMLAGLELSEGGALAHITVTREMLSRTGTTEEDTDNFTNYPMNVDGVLAGILFLELQDGLKISFRSRGEISINELAKEFGGNGHKNAAGARIEGGSLEEVRLRVLKAARKYVTR
ncbi:MAG: bifunctional oligoribonuclease/PAP phosphatase NrnA [Bacteroidota bacterium]